MNYISKRVSIVSMSFEIESIRSINYENFRLFLMNNKSIPSGLLLSQLLIQKNEKEEEEVEKELVRKKTYQSGVIMVGVWPDGNGRKQYRPFIRYPR